MGSFVQFMHLLCSLFGLFMILFESNHLPSLRGVLVLEKCIHIVASSFQDVVHFYAYRLLCIFLAIVLNGEGLVCTF